MRGDADQVMRSQNAPRVGGRQGMTGKMNAGSAEGQSDIQAIVDEQRDMVCRQGHVKLFAQGTELSGTEVFFTQLHHAGTALGGARHDLHERPPLRLLTVRDDIESRDGTSGLRCQ
jgi:hypothetical protein